MPRRDFPGVDIDRVHAKRAGHAAPQPKCNCAAFGEYVLTPVVLVWVVLSLARWIAGL